MFQKTANGAHSQIRIRFTTLTFLCLLLCLCQVQAATPRVGVIYPHSDTAFRLVFDKINNGIESNSKVSSSFYEIPEDASSEDVNQWILQQKPDVVITLGSRPLQILEQLEQHPPLVCGAILGSRNDTYGTSLSGDPAVFLEMLKSLTPEVKRVFLVYSRNNSEWLIPQAKKAARQFKLELVSEATDNRKEAFLQLDQFIEQAGKHDSIWLMSDGALPDSVVLPRLLTASWNQNFLLFGSNPLQVKKGVLFALYPDYFEIGKRLADQAVTKFTQSDIHGLKPNHALKSAVNRRTASHLGITLGRRLQSDFNLVFPQ